MTGFHVSADGLRTHAGHLEDASSAVDLAKDAVGTVHLDMHAFGLMCSALIPIISGHEQDASAAVTSIGSLLSRSGAGMRQMADDYDGSDTAAESRFKVFDAALGA